MNKNLLLKALLLIVVSLVSSIAFAQEDGEITVNMMTREMMSHARTGDVQPIPDSKVTLLTNDDGAWFHISTTGLVEGDVYTVWWVITNNPDACEARPCVGSDVFGNSEAVEAELTLGDTFLMDAEANVSLAGYLPIGDVESAWYGNGFTNPTGAEIWIVINHHGTLIPGEAGDMLNTYRGGCTDETAGGPFPDTGMADGKPGPNTCLLSQIATFAQGME